MVDARWFGVIVGGCFWVLLIVLLAFMDVYILICGVVCSFDFGLVYCWFVGYLAGLLICCCFGW